MMLPDYRIRQRDYLLEISRAISQELDLATLLERILKISIELLAGQAGLIVLRSETGEWVVRVTEGISSAFINELAPLLRAIPENEDPAQFEIPELNRILKELTFATTLGILSGVGLPMVTHQRVMGVIFIFRSYPGIFTPNDRVLLSAFADQAAVAIQNAQLYRSVTKNKQHLDAVLDTAADGILILSAGQIIDRCNPAFTRMIGMAPEEVIGKPHEEILRLTKLYQEITLEKAIAGGWPLTPHAQLYVEGDLKRNDLVPIPVGITYAPLLSNEGILLNIIATVRDISRFREADELKSTFISVISHELKTPVALIKGYVCTLLREDAHWDRKLVNESLHIIEEEADRLSQLIENLLDATRLQAGGVALKKSDILLETIVKRLITRFQTQTDKHTFAVDFPPNFPVVMADEVRIDQVISNLISNSIKYSPSGEIRISARVRNEYAIICVSDQGPGIAPQDVPYVFDRFYRSEDATKNKKGAGLGLFLAKSIIEAHGGKMWIDNDHNRGAKICFSLPLDVE